MAGLMSADRTDPLLEKGPEGEKGFLGIPGGLWKPPQRHGPREAPRRKRQEGNPVAMSPRSWQWGKAPEERNPKGVTSLE